MSGKPLNNDGTKLNYFASVIEKVKAPPTWLTGSLLKVYTVNYKRTERPPAPPPHFVIASQVETARCFYIISLLTIH